MKSSDNRYARIIEFIFNKHYKKNEKSFFFVREEIIEAAKILKIDLPKNIGDVIYSFKYRGDLPKSITKTAPNDFSWRIRTAGASKYEFCLTKFKIDPNQMLCEIKIPDATPGVIAEYSLDDEQAILARIRYNRLIDIFTGLTCYSLQNHLRTHLKNLGQVETDEIYIGIDKRGAHYIIPIQAKGKKDKIGITQIEQDLALCREKFPQLISKLIAAQFHKDNLIVLYEFEEVNNEINLVTEKHYRLVHPGDLSNEELDIYKRTIE